MAQPQFAEKIRPGMSIAVTAGSRGIRNVDIITKAVVDFVKQKGASPFIVPAMGSHGGATAEGQVEILESFGITEKQWDVLSVLLWRLWSWAIPVWDAELL